MDENNNLNIPLNQPSLQVPSSIPIRESTSKSNILLFIVLGLIVIAGSIFIGIHIGKNQITTQPQIVQSPTISPTQGVADPTANWKTYSNKEFGIELKYPNHWNTFSQTDTIIAFSDNNNEGLNKFEGIMANLSTKKNTICDIEKLFENKEPIPVRFGSCTQDSLSNINGNILMTFTFSPSDNIPAETIYAKGFAIKKSDQIFVFVIESFYIENIDTKILDKILSSFKFTD